MRAAVVGGVAYGAGRRAARHQQNEQELAAYQQQEYAEQYAASQPPAPPSADDKFAELEKLAKLKDAGVLTQEEFDAQKAKILQGL